LDGKSQEAAWKHGLSQRPVRLAPSLSRMGFDRVYPVYYEISFELETENERDL
jgi:hypothetical protein